MNTFQGLTIVDNQTLHDNVHNIIWKWCTFCNSWTVICSICNTNMCSGTYGKLKDGSECKTCSKMYEYEREMFKFFDPNLSLTP